MSRLASTGIETAYREMFPTSARLYDRGCRVFPSGVTHDGRYLQPFPIYIERTDGSRKYDVDGHDLVDYWVGHGALLLGHGHPDVTSAVERQIGRGTHMGGCHELELEWGEAVCRLIPSAEMVRFTNSGTEATLMALRLARIVTGRSKVVKFAGHFHGWHDLLMPGADPPHTADDYAMPGVTAGVYGDLVIVPPNDLTAVAQALEDHSPACVFMEGNGGHWGRVPMRPDFLQGLRQLTKEKDVLLILDEVITGFRVHPGGFQGYCDVVPDLTTLAKVLAGGLPGGCVAGRTDLMQTLAFDNSLGLKMAHPGTFNANPLSAAAGVAALGIVETGRPCRQANEVAFKIRAGLNELFARKSVDWIAYGDFSAIKILPDYEGPRPDDAMFIPYANDYKRLDAEFDPALSHALRCAVLLGGVDWWGWNATTSAAHTEADIDRTISAFSRAIDMLRVDGLLT